MSLWQWSENQQDGVMTFRVYYRTSELSFIDVLELLASSAEFRAFFIQVFQKPLFTAYKWETPALAKGENTPFECVMLNTPALVRPASSAAFDGYLTGADRVVQFNNLGKDAWLVVPTACAEQTDYCHLASFSATAAVFEQTRLWQKVAEAVLARLSSQPIWLNTAGEGVPWLHVRIDQAPKYYGYTPYKKWTKS